MDTIPVDEVETGDILLVTRAPNDALAQLIVDLDQSERGFSHAGVAGEEPGTIVCSYPTWSWQDPGDVGGIYHLSFSYFFDERKQAIHRLRLPHGASNARAQRELQRYPRDRDGAFGWAKCVMVAAALHTLAAEKRIGPAAVTAIVDQAISAAKEWESPDDFYCAEFVAYLYGLQFPVDRLRPPHLLSSTPPRPTVANPWTGLKRAVGQTVLQAFASENQSRALRDFSRVVTDNNPAFFELGFERIREFASDAISGALDDVFGGGPAHGPMDGGASGESDRDVPTVPLDALPYALVTPRMLEEWGDGTDVIEGSPDVGDIGWRPYE